MLELSKERGGQGGERSKGTEEKRGDKGKGENGAHKTETCKGRSLILRIFIAGSRRYHQNLVSFSPPLTCFSLYDEPHFLARFHLNSGQMTACQQLQAYIS